MEGAKIYAVYWVHGSRPSPNIKPRAMTDANGMFSFSVTADGFEPTADNAFEFCLLIVTAEGFGFAAGKSPAFETTGELLKLKSVST